MNKKSKYYENLGSIISFIKNEYPIKVSKNFSTKVMNDITSYSQKHPSFFSLSSIAKVASVFVFAVITIYTLQYNDNQIEYTGKSFDNEYPYPTKNVINESNNCADDGQLSSNEVDKKCK